MDTPRKTVPEDEIVRIRPSGAASATKRKPKTIVMPDGTQQIPLGSGVVSSFLGEGGMANVYEIWNGQLEIARAVKLINPNCSRDARERFQTEMKISAKLHHPNITEIYGVGNWNGLPYIEMEKLEGVSLDEVVRIHGALPAYVCTAMGIMVARALKYAHNTEYDLYGTTYHGVIHRDLKPANVMICSNGNVKLMDFGIASPAEASFHTVAGTVLGTLQYLAPEQLESKKLDVRTDLYSLATTLYEILTGMMAFPEPGVHKLMLDKLKSRFKYLDQYRLRVPRSLRRLIHRCMHNDKARRVASSADMLKELDRIHTRLTTDSPEEVLLRLLQTPPSEKIVVTVRRTWPLPLAAGLVAGALVGYSLWTLIPYFRYAVSPKVTIEPVKPRVATLPPVAGEATTEPRSTLPAASRPRPVSNRVSVAEPEPKKPRPKTFVETMQEKHETDDVLGILKKEYKAGSYANALTAFGHLSESQKSSVEARIYHLRTLSALGYSAQMHEFVRSTDANDGEFILAKVRLAYESGETARATELLGTCLAAPRKFMDYDELKREVSYYRALCATRTFDNDPSEENYKAAMDLWWQLRSQLRNDPNHAYHAKVISETQRIGQKRRESRG